MVLDNLPAHEPVALHEVLTPEFARNGLRRLNGMAPTDVNCRCAGPLPFPPSGSGPDHAGHSARAKRSTERAISTNSATFLKVSGSVLTKPRLPAATPAIRIGAKTAVRQ